MLNNNYCMFIEYFKRIQQYDCNFNKKKVMFSNKFENCIDACYHCATACLQCENVYMWENGNKGHRSSLRLDCAEICLAAAKLMSAKSKFSSGICALCAEICENCAEECKQHATLQQCKNCAESCLNCAEECRKISADAN